MNNVSTRSKLLIVLCAACIAGAVYTTTTSKERRFHPAIQNALDNIHPNCGERTVEGNGVKAHLDGHGRLTVQYPGQYAKIRCWYDSAHVDSSGQLTVMLGDHVLLLADSSTVLALPSWTRKAKHNLKTLDSCFKADPTNMMGHCWDLGFVDWREHVQFYNISQE